MSENTKRLRGHVTSYKSMSPHRQNCLDVCDEVDQLAVEVKSLRKVLNAAQVPRHDYCGTDNWFINLDKAVYEATTDVGEQYRDKYADSGRNYG